MQIITIIATVTGIFVAILGILGGLLALPIHIKKFKKALRPYGEKGTGFYILNRQDTSESMIVTFLVVEDLFHFLKNFDVSNSDKSIISVEGVGEYYKVVVSLPPGSKFKIMNKNKT